MASDHAGTLLPTSTDEEIKPPFPYMNRIIKFSKLIYMWPNTNNINRFRYHFMVWFITFNCVLMVMSFTVQIRREYKNMDSITELIDFDTVLISGVFRYTYIYVRGNKYLQLVHLMHTKFIHRPFLPTKNLATLDKYYRLANRIIMTYSVFTIFWILQICSTPILGYAWAVHARTNESEAISYPVVMKVYIPFNVRVQPQNGLFYFYQVVWFMTFGWIYVVVDSFWYMVILLTIGQFGLIKESINTMTEILNNKSADVSLLRKEELLEVEAGLRRCVTHHQFVRQFVHMLDSISNPNILVDSLHAVISIGFILLDVTIALNVGDWNKVMYCMEYFITSIVHMFFFDWLGNELAEKEEELAEAVYQIPWYKCPMLKTDFLLISIQSRRPYRLTGGRMYKLSLDFFTSTVKAVFSYFTFLFQLRNK